MQARLYATAYLLNHTHIAMLIRILAALAPVVLLLMYIYNQDKKAPEPTDLLFKAFRYGVLSAIVVMLVLSPFGSNEIPTDFFESVKVSFFEAGIPEEFFKWLFLYILIWKSPQFDEYIDGLVYAVFVSMGFACLENVMYVVPGGMSVAVSRALLSVPAHFLFAVIMGYYFSLAKFNPDERTKYMSLSIVLPMIAHGMFDTLAFWMDTLNDYSVYIVVFVLFLVGDLFLWRLGIRKIRSSVMMSDEARADTEDLVFVQAQDAAEAFPTALPADGEWVDTPIAVYHVGAEATEDNPIDAVATFKLLIECKADAKIYINESDAFFARGGVNYRLTLPAGKYTVRAVNLARYEQCVSQEVNLVENRRITVAFSGWERLPAWARTVIVAALAIAALSVFGK